MWILILIGVVAGGEGGRSIEHIELSSRERCVAAQQFSIKRENIKDAYCIQK